MATMADKWQQQEQEQKATLESFYKASEQFRQQAEAHGQAMSMNCSAMIKSENAAYRGASK